MSNDETGSASQASSSEVEDDLTPEDEAAADRARNDPELAGDQQEVAKHYREMTELGANAKGEGKID
jgi:hypothetical protein